MALIINTNIENQTNGYLLDSKNVKGTYVTVGTSTDRDSLPESTTVKGSLCYVSSEDKTYKYNGTAWEEYSAGGSGNCVEEIYAKPNTQANKVRYIKNDLLDNFKEYSELTYKYNSNSSFYCILIKTSDATEGQKVDIVFEDGVKISWYYNKPLEEQDKRWDLLDYTSTLSVYGFQLQYPIYGSRTRASFTEENTYCIELTTFTNYIKLRVVTTDENYYVYDDTKTMVGELNNSYHTDIPEKYSYGYLALNYDSVFDSSAKELNFNEDMDFEFGNCTFDYSVENRLFSGYGNSGGYPSYPLIVPFNYDELGWNSDKLNSKAFVSDIELATKDYVDDKLEESSGPSITVTDTYDANGTDAVSGKAVASAISNKANTSQLGTQVTYTLNGTSLYITTK